MSALELSDVERVKACLAFLASNPYEVRAEWRNDVLAEARKLGLLPPEKPAIGCNCRPGIDARVIYGGDYPDL